ncbi:hypothetical protein ACVBEF_06270 [Glaciimonas sp. GG7]
MLNKIITALLWVISLVTAPVHAGTVAGTGGATEITQLLNNVQLVMQYTTQIQQYESQLQNLLKQKDLLTLNPRGYITVLANAAEGGEALGLGGARITKKLETAYGSDYKKNAAYSSQDFETWMKTTKDSIRGAMKSVGVQQDDMASEADLIMSLKTLSNSSAGNLQVSQTGNQISIQMLQQFQKLRQMNLAQASAMNARMLAVQNKEEQDRAETQQFFGGAVKPMRSLIN